ncbi:MAG: hypothetical protein R3F11_04780 [Verrucomicrobiales bacterium]
MAVLAAGPAHAGPPLGDGYVRSISCEVLTLSAKLESTHWVFADRESQNDSDLVREIQSNAKGKAKPLDLHYVQSRSSNRFEARAGTGKWTPGGFGSTNYTAPTMMRLVLTEGSEIQFDGVLGDFGLVIHAPVAYRHNGGITQRPIAIDRAGRTIDLPRFPVVEFESELSFRPGYYGLAAALCPDAAGGADPAAFVFTRCCIEPREGRVWWKRDGPYRDADGNYTRTGPDAFNTEKLRLSQPPIYEVQAMLFKTPQRSGEPDGERVPAFDAVSADGWSRLFAYGSVAVRSGKFKARRGEIIYDVAGVHAARGTESDLSPIGTKEVFSGIALVGSFAPSEGKGEAGKLTLAFDCDLAPPDFPAAEAQIANLGANGDKAEWLPPVRHVASARLDEKEIALGVPMFLGSWDAPGDGGDGDRNADAEGGAARIAGFVRVVRR